MADEFVDEIVAQKAFNQLVIFRKEVKETVADIATLSKSAREAFDGFGNNSTLSERIKQTKAQAAANAEVINKVESLTDAYKRQEAALKQALLVEKQKTEQSKQSAQATVASAKASTENAKAKEIEAKYTIILQKEMERIEKLRDREAAQLARSETAYAKLSAEHKEAAATAKNLGAEYELLQRSLSGSLSQGVRADKTAELQKLTPVMLAAQKNANSLHQSLLKVDQAVGDSRRNVGNYNGAVMAMSQILREAPSFAYSFATGLSGIGNNIPILVDEITKLKAANEALKASGQATIPVWKTLMGAFTSPVGIITAVTAVVTILAARMTMAGNAAKDAADGTNKYEDRLKSLIDTVSKFNATLQSSIQLDQQSASSFMRRIENGNINDKIAAYGELRSLIPGVLDDLDKEQIKRFTLTASIKEQINAAAKLNQEIRNGRDVQKEYVKVQNETQEQIRLKQEQVNLERKKLLEGGNGKQALPQSVVDRMTNSYKNERVADLPLLGVGNYQRAIAELNTLQDSLANTRALAVALNANIQNKEFALGEMAGKTKDKKTTTPKDNTLKNEQDLTKEIYDEYQKRLLLQAEVQKAISEDETKSLEERLIAYQQFAELSFDAETVKSVGELEILKQSLTEIEKLEGISASKRTRQQKDLLGKKALLLQQYDNISADFNLKEQKHIEATAKGIVSIQQDEVKKRIDAIKLLTDNVDIQEARAGQLLAESLKKGEINYKQYVQKKKELEDKYQVERFTQIKDYLTAEIEALSKQGVDTRQLQELLNKDLANLSDADLKKFLDNAKIKEQNQQLITQKVWEATGEAISSAASIADSYFERQLAQQQELLDGVEKRKNAELDAIEKSSLSDKQKLQESIALTAKAAAEEKKITDEIARIKRKQAIADRAAALLGVAQNTAMGITAVWANPLTIAAAPILTPIIAGIGLAQAAAILAKPLPAYAEGTDNHPGGLALIGEEHKPELVIEPGKSPYVVDKPTVRALAPRTRVIPQAELLANSLGFMTPSLLAQMQIPANDYSALQDTIRETAAQTANVIRNMPQTKFVVSNGEWQKVIINGSSVTKRINKNIC